MPSFDVISEIDMQEVRNAVDQTAREISQRFDFKGTDSTVELKEKTIEIHTESEPRLQALRQVLEEKMVKRQVSLKALDFGQVEEATKGTVRQTVTLRMGITDEKAKAVGKFIKGLGMKGVSHQIQGDQVRVTGKKRDDLQSVIAALKDEDFDLPLQFQNFRD
jgi:cyclic-di-GMP-binding protein